MQCSSLNPHPTPPLQHHQQLYHFELWESTNAATGAKKIVKTNLYEEVADADYTVKAVFAPLKVRKGRVCLCLCVLGGLHERAVFGVA